MIDGLRTYQSSLIELAIDFGVLRFGAFTLKSGRTSPYFFNTGGFHNGFALAALGHFYADAIIESGREYDVLMGPAYKGIPLAAATAVQLAEQHDINAPWCFNRKEAKDHGEGGTIVGSPLEGRVLIIDDVITAGTAIREVVDIVDAAGAEVAGVMVAVDRQERGRGELSAIGEVERDLGIGVDSIITFSDLITYMEETGDYDEHLEPMYQYRDEYGV